MWEGPGSTPFPWWGCPLSRAKVKKALTIAGSDPSGGAGIQADLRVFAVLGVYGTAVVTAMTVQNTEGVKEVIKVPAEIIKKQLATLLDDITIDAVKTGILTDGDHIKVVGDIITQYGMKNYVLDPILWSSRGFPFLHREDVEALKKHLLPLALVVTPNIHEAEVLSGTSISSLSEMKKAAEIIYSYGPRAVLIKGGHLTGRAQDLLYTGRGSLIFEKKRIEGARLHGAGCVFSSALTAGIAKGLSVEEAAKRAKSFATDAIRSSVKVGKGSSSLNCFRKA